MQVFDFLVAEPPVSALWTNFRMAKQKRWITTCVVQIMWRFPKIGVSQNHPLNAWKDVECADQWMYPFYKHSASAARLRNLWPTRTCRDCSMLKSCLGDRALSTKKWPIGQAMAPWFSCHDSWFVGKLQYPPYPVLKAGPRSGNDLQTIGWHHTVWIQLRCLRHTSFDRQNHHHS